MELQKKEIPLNLRLIDMTVEQLITVYQNTLPVKNIDEQIEIFSTKKVNLNKLCEVYQWPRQTVYCWVTNDIFLIQR